MRTISNLPKVLPTERKIKLVNVILSIVFLIAVTYTIRYLFFDSKDISLPLLAPFLILPPFLKLLIHFGKIDLSAMIGLLGFNIALFLVASSESLETGVYLHFVSASAVAISLFEYEDKEKSIFFVSLSVALFLMVNLLSFDFISFREYSPENEDIFYTAHTLGMTASSCFSLFMVLGTNYSLQKFLIRNKRVIELQNDELQKRNEELDRFVYSASHDLRAPLASIKGVIGLMKLENKDDSEYSTMIMDRISVMEDFIHDIVHYSRNTRAEVKIEKIVLFDLIIEIQKALSHFENAQKIELKNQVDQSLIIESDAYRLRVILTNFISNAIKYADLSKERPSVVIRFEEQDKQNIIRVEDNGIGIDKNHVTEVFRMFYRASQISEGSGLGLYIAIESAKKLGYELEVQSTKGEGSTFLIKILKN